MSDLVERLRDQRALDENGRNILVAAADEIERLLDKIADLSCQVSNGEAEIERLQDMLAGSRDVNAANVGRIERLRAALERLAYDSHGYADDKSGAWHMAKIAREALKGE